MNESGWIITCCPTICLSCRKAIAPGSRVYSLTGTDRDAYCEKHGPRAEAAMQQRERQKERLRRIIAGVPA